MEQPPALGTLGPDCEALGVSRISSSAPSENFDAATGSHFAQLAPVSAAFSWEFEPRTELNVPWPVRKIDGPAEAIVIGMPGSCPAPFAVAGAITLEGGGLSSTPALDISWPNASPPELLAAPVHNMRFWARVGAIYRIHDVQIPYDEVTWDDLGPFLGEDTGGPFDQQDTHLMWDLAQTQGVPAGVYSPRWGEPLVRTGIPTQLGPFDLLDGRLTWGYQGPGTALAPAVPPAGDRPYLVTIKPDIEQTLAVFFPPLVINWGQVHFTSATVTLEAIANRPFGPGIGSHLEPVLPLLHFGQTVL